MFQDSHNKLLSRSESIDRISEKPVYEEKEKKDPFKSLYTKARKTQHARIRYNIKNKPDYREDHYEPWKKAAEQARDYYKKQNDIDGFQKWIEDNKNQVIDLSIVSNVPVFSMNGEGVLFEFINDIEKLEGNPLVTLYKFEEVDDSVSDIVIICGEQTGKDMRQFKAIDE